ncbi:MAG: GNAT family N-acetyltransferase [Pseudomonadota bacterium]
MTDLEIRDYQPGDRAALLALVRELQAAEGALYDRMKPPEAIGDWYVDGLLESCRTKQGRILVACDGGAPVGYAVILTEVSSEDELDEIDFTYAYVQDIAVGARMRRRGIGARLLGACEEIARAAGARWLRISVLSDNQPAVGAYLKTGFKPLFTELEKPL